MKLTIKNVKEPRNPPKLPHTVALPLAVASLVQFMGELLAKKRFPCHAHLRMMVVTDLRCKANFRSETTLWKLKRNVPCHDTNEKILTCEQLKAKHKAWKKQ